MDRFDPATLQVGGGMVLLAVLFVLREFASGALKQAGEEFWLWLRRRTGRGQAVAAGEHNDKGTGEQADSGSCSSAGAEDGTAETAAPCVLTLPRGDAPAASTRRIAVGHDEAMETPRKSA